MDIVKRAKESLKGQARRAVTKMRLRNRLRSPEPLGLGDLLELVSASLDEAWDERDRKREEGKERYRALGFAYDDDDAADYYDVFHHDVGDR
jgi:hypothetical protein